MAGIFAYSALSLLGLILLAVSYFKTRSLKTIGVFLAMIGVYGLAEYPIFIWGKAYKYIPGILPNEFDNLLGSIISGVLCLPAAAMFISALSLNWGWIVVAAAWFCAVEEAFLKLKIYEQNWWSTWFTFLSVMIFTWITKFIYQQLEERHSRIFSFGVLVLTLHGVRILGAMTIYAFIESRKYHIEWLTKIGLPSTAINAPISIIMAVIYAALMIYTKRSVWKVGAVASIFLVDLWMKKMQYVQTVSSWDSFYYVLADMITVVMGALFARLYRR